MRRNQDAVHVLHGPWVETREDRFFEGAWDGDFQTGAFDDAVSFMGSGGRLAGDRIVFAGPTHKLDRIYSLRASETLYVSNSLVLLLTRAGDDLDLSYPYYFFDYLNYFRAGIRTKVKPIPLRSGNSACLNDCCNLLVSPGLCVERVEKRIAPPPACFHDYADFLEKAAQRISANAASPARKRAFRPIAAISRGYDSVAVAALASRAACKRAITFRQSGKSGVDDSGAQIAAHLGMEIKEYDRADYAKVPGLPEIEFYPHARLASKAFTVFEDQLAGSLFFNGQSGEDAWNTGGPVALPLLQEPTAYTMSGSNLTEFRLRVGFIFFPLACCGAIHAPVVAEIGRSREMEPWSVGGEYDRPIPRRIAEERGVPRPLFGQINVGGGPDIGQLGLCPASDEDFRRFYADFASRQRRRRRWPGLSRWFLYGLLCKYPRIARLFGRIVGDLSDPAHRSLALYTFHWGFQRLKERYEKAVHAPSG